MRKTESEQEKTNEAVFRVAFALGKECQALINIGRADKIGPFITAIVRNIGTSVGASSKKGGHSGLIVQKHRQLLTDALNDGITAGYASGPKKLS